MYKNGICYFVFVLLITSTRSNSVIIRFFSIWLALHRLSLREFFNMFTKRNKYKVPAYERGKGSNCIRNWGADRQWALRQSMFSSSNSFSEFERLESWKHLFAKYRTFFTFFHTYFIREALRILPFAQSRKSFLNAWNIQFRFRKRILIIIKTELHIFKRINNLFYSAI